jgi:phospholipid/cholesterol/gamma-HCH transport system permease protein
MTVTEQIHAMRALGTDPTKKLVTPRVVATTLMLFFLTIVGDLMGLVGGNFVATGLMGVDSRQYWHKVRDALEFADVFIGLTKPLIFGFIIATVGCYFGLSTRGGTQGVGRSTTVSVVASMILVIIVDVIVTRFLMVVLGS